MLIERTREEALKDLVAGKEVIILDNPGKKILSIMDFLPKEKDGFRFLADSEPEKSGGVAKKSNRKATTAQKKELVEQGLASGKSLKQIAAETGIHLSSVYNYAKQIPIKPAKKSINENRELCKKCKFRNKNGSGCNYIVMTGKERGCDVENCDKYEGSA